jgi:Transposase, Mutator family
MRLAEGHAMSDTAMVPRKNDSRPAGPAPLIDEQLADQLLGKAQAEGVELLGPDGLLSQVTKAVLERALAEEMTEHLGYEKHDPAGRGSGNSRNGSTGKTLLTDIGAVDLAVPRDRNGSFDPKIVRKGQTRLEGFNDRIIALYARGMTTRDIRASLRARSPVSGPVRSQPYSAVDAFPQQVGVADMAGVFLDHVDQHLPQRHLAVVPAAAGVGLGEVQVAGLIDEALGESDLIPPVLPSQRDRGRIGNRIAEGPVVVVSCAVPVASRRILARHHPAEPVPLRIRQMANQAKQRQVRRLDRTARHGLGVEA